MTINGLGAAAPVKVSSIDDQANVKAEIADKLKDAALEKNDIISAQESEIASLLFSDELMEDFEIAGITPNEDIAPAIAWGIFLVVARAAAYITLRNAPKYMSRFVTRAKNLNISRVSTSSSHKTITEVVRKYNNTVKHHLSDRDISGAVRDIFGKPVKVKGKLWNHAGEVKDAMKNMSNAINTLKSARFGGNTAAKNEATRVIRHISVQKDRLRDFIIKAVDASGR